MKKIGDKQVFTGGAEETLLVEVVQHRMPGSMNDGEKTLKIKQGGSYVILSPETMTLILC